MLIRQKIDLMGGIVEEFLEGKSKRSPSAQFRVDPAGVLEVISTHDQVLGGSSGQVFLGCAFPADAGPPPRHPGAWLSRGPALASKGVLGRFGIDFLSVPEDSGWRHYAIEINLRKGGTTHPFLMLQFLTAGSYDSGTGLFLSAAGRACSYFAFGQSA